jgi:lactate dehydrogenase-like 2-hydroxyacid dehydrogenase
MTTDRTLSLSTVTHIIKAPLETPHIGYVSRDLYPRFYQDTVDNIGQWLDGRQVLTPAVAGKFLRHGGHDGRAA